MVDTLYSEDGYAFESGVELYEETIGLVGFEIKFKVGVYEFGGGKGNDETCDTEK